jgi:Mg2+ and Co2+ transporter CorA
MNFKNRIQTIPILVNSIKDLIVKMEQEISEYSDIANSFHNIIQSFVKVVMNTKHNMKMAQPLLDESVVHMR